jgi:hypothetical protein
MASISKAMLQHVVAQSRVKERLVYVVTPPSPQHSGARSTTDLVQSGSIACMSIRARYTTVISRKTTLRSMVQQCTFVERAHTTCIRVGSPATLLLEVEVPLLSLARYLKLTYHARKSSSALGNGSLCMLQSSATFSKLLVENNVAAEGAGLFCSQEGSPVVRYSIFRYVQLMIALCSDCCSDCCSGSSITLTDWLVQ